MIHDWSLFSWRYFMGTANLWPFPLLHFRRLSCLFDHHLLRWGEEIWVFSPLSSLAGKCTWMNSERHKELRPSTIHLKTRSPVYLEFLRVKYNLWWPYYKCEISLLYSHSNVPGMGGWHEWQSRKINPAIQVLLVQSTRQVVNDKGLYIYELGVNQRIKKRAELMTYTEEWLISPGWGRHGRPYRGDDI